MVSEGQFAHVIDQDVQTQNSHWRLPTSHQHISQYSNLLLYIGNEGQFAHVRD